MKPIETLLHSDAPAPRGLLFDLDDTFLEAGRLTLPAYSALFALREAGLRLCVVTGRPASWGQFCMTQWPIDGAVTENGGTLCVRDGRRLVEYAPAGVDTARNTRRLAEITAAVRAEFPELELTGDVLGRRSDVTFDIAETRQVPLDVVEAVTQFARRHGAMTQRSSIHLHLSFHGQDKASGALALLGRLFGEEPSDARFHYAYIGDSENDAACFAAFLQSIGVANLSGRLTLPPRYRTRATAAAGFCEAAAVLLRTRGQSQRA